MADFALRIGWIDTTDASGRVGVKWYIRSAKPSDRMELAALIHASAERGWGPDSISSAIAASGGRVRLAQASDGGLLGFVLARRILDLLEIDLVGVRREHRRSGIARELLNGLIEDEAGKGLVEVRLELAASNEPASGLYAGLDFVVVGRRTRYYPDGDDAVLLSRMISSGRSLPP
jgi:ribosomal-protein-alanine N-acetyltransferase